MANTKMSIEDRRKKLKELVDTVITNGWESGKFIGQDLHSRDEIIIKDYCNKLGFEPKINGEFLSLHLMLPKKEENFDEVHVSLEDYKMLKFVRKNPIFKLLYRFFG